jgi:hypothetical protein
VRGPRLRRGPLVLIGEERRMTQNPPTAETLGSVFEYLFQSSDISMWTISWPPDAFCFVATALQRSSAYTALVGTGKPRLDFKHAQEDREEALEAIGRKWRAAAGKSKLPPPVVRKWLEIVRSNRALPLTALGRRKQVLAALLNILAAADEACAGLGISLTSTDDDEFTRISESQLFPMENGSTLCKRIHPSKARVLPKCHTAQTGLTIRSFSHFLALVATTEISPQWYSFCAETSDHALNLLLVPWPNRIIPKQFRATERHRMTDDVERGAYGMFTFDPVGPLRSDVIRKLVGAAEKTVGRIDGVVIPELGLTPRSVEQISKAVVREDRFLIAGVGQPAQEGTSGENYIRFDVMLPGGEYCATLKQEKHHRWKLDKNQIMQYGIGSILNPQANWWEHIDVKDRCLMLVTLKPWLTVCVLICEDLARPDPLGDLVHSVGPNLLICLLMDGPQLSSRWPGRYATTFADDPGCSVLTLTSAGMANLSRPSSGASAPSGCIALWKDARSGGAKEIILPAGADAVVLSAAVEYCEEWTADGRGDGGNAGHPYLVGQHPIRLDKI